MKHLLAAILVVGGASIASAADFGRPAPSIPAAFDWTGFYAGAHLGYGWGDSGFVDGDYNGSPPDYPTVVWNSHSDGVLYGIQAGYNWQFGNVVFGLEGEIGHLGIDGSALQPGLDPYGVPYDAFGTTDGGWYLGLGARLGLAFDRVLLYAKGGAVYSGAKVGLLDTCTVSPCGDSIFDASAKVGWGYQIGGGLEYAVADNWTVKAEYAYFDFGSETITGVAVGGTFNGQTFNVSGDLSVHTIKVGVNYKFP